jgi:hypothetical protein
MDFNTLCDLVLGESSSVTPKDVRFVVSNDSPLFTSKDVLNDPLDPSQGSRMSIKNKYGEKGSAGSQLRRINWVVRKLNKKFNKEGKSLNLYDLRDAVIEYLTRFQKEVMGKEDRPTSEVSPEDEHKYINNEETLRETRFICGLLLEPTENFPNAKSMFTVSEELTKPEETKGISEPEGKPIGDEELSVEPIDSEEVENLMHNALDTVEELSDVSMIEKIKEIIDGGIYNEEDDTYYEPTRNEIVKHPDLKEYSSKAIKIVLKGLEKSGIITYDREYGSYSLKREDEGDIEGQVATMRSEVPTLEDEPDFTSAEDDFEQFMPPEDEYDTDAYMMDDELAQLDLGYRGDDYEDDEYDEYDEYGNY